MMAALFCFFLSSIFCVLSSNLLVAAQKRVYTNTLVSQVNKNNDLDFGPYLMGFPHGLRKTNPTQVGVSRWAFFGLTFFTSPIK